MKTLLAITILVLAANGAHARSRNGGVTGLGNLRPNPKAAVASAKDLDRAKKLADQARARIGAGNRRSAWAYGGK